VIIPHANQWAACAVLGQEHDGRIQPVHFTGRVLNDAELRYHITEKEVIAVMQVLRVFRTLLEGCPLVGTQFSSGLSSPRLPMDVRCPGASHSRITTSKSGRSDGTRMDSLPSWVQELLHESTWIVLDARGFILEDVTVNDAEYYGLLKGLDMALEHNIQDLVVVGDSRIVIQQVQGLINCHQPNLQRRLAECEVLKEKFQRLRLVHVKRDFNHTADYLTSKTLVLDESWTVHDEDERRHLEVVSKIHEQLMKPPVVIQDVKDEDTKIDPRNIPNDDAAVPNVSQVDGLPGPESAPLTPAARVMAVLTRSAAAEVSEERPAMSPLEYQAERWRRIKAHQEMNEHLSEIAAFLNGDLEQFSPRRLRKISKEADLFALDERGILYRLA
jgi:ribonuclease HI